MNTDSLAGLSSTLDQARTASAIGTAVLRKALDAEAQAYQALVQLIPAARPLATSGTLGTRLDTFA